MLNKTFQILELLCATRSSYKIISASMGDNCIGKPLSDKLGNLKKRGLVNYDNGFWDITKKGRSYYRTHTNYKYFNSSLDNKKKNRNMLIIFDIPEKERSKRDWLRHQIKQFYYVQIQQSVWHGPSPLPKDFVEYLDELNIKKYLRFFNINNKL